MKNHLNSVSRQKKIPLVLADTYKEIHLKMLISQWHQNLCHGQSYSKNLQ